MSEWKDIPAFPSANEKKVGDFITGGHAGMSLRDYFAGQTLQRVYLDTRNPDLTASFCYEMADAMLKARTQPPISEDI